MHEGHATRLNAVKEALMVHGIGRSHSRPVYAKRVHTEKRSGSILPVMPRLSRASTP